MNDNEQILNAIIGTRDFLQSGHGRIVTHFLEARARRMLEELAMRGSIREADLNDVNATLGMASAILAIAREGSLGLAEMNSELWTEFSRKEGTDDAVQR